MSSRKDSAVDGCSESHPRLSQTGPDYLAAVFHSYHAPMHTFFHSWRRKAGCVTLVIACAVFLMWMRSYSFEDRVNCASGMSVHDFLSRCGTIQWHKSTPAWIASGWSTQALSPSDNQIYDRDPEFFKTNLSWEWLGFISCETRFQFSDLKDRVWIAPYWMAVLPLTLLSAYLILWKPRTRA